MSNFSSLKNVPPVLQNLTPEKAWKKLQDPLAIAILASLGVHGLLWFGLPLLPSSTTKPTEQRTLNVVELSPLEQQARLPDSTALLKPIPPRSSAQTSGASTADVPLVPVDPSLPDPNPFYQIPETSSSRSTTDYSTTRRSTSKSTTRQEQTPKDAETEATQTDETASDKTSTSSADLADPNGKPLSKNREAQEKLALQQSFAFNAAGTTDQDFVANSQIAANQIADKFNIRDWEKPIATRSAYPPEACQFQHEGKPVQGITGLVVVMQPDGSLSDTALLVKSSGFKGLDEAARKYVERQWSDIVKQHNVEPGNKPQAFPLAIAVEPAEGDCAGTQKPAS
ncbi:MAG: hypothetical protein NW220_03095 [Leptolyngbyaceae cyanobacterium bins.349]|nr:hypothetical protein [Leptolyngbyaceae cyanobacterium bins.349]